MLTNANATSSAGDRPTLTACKRLTDDFRKRMLSKNSVILNRFSERDTATGREAKGN